MKKEKTFLIAFIIVVVSIVYAKANIDKAYRLGYSKGFNDGFYDGFLYDERTEDYGEFEDYNPKYYEQYR